MKWILSKVLYLITAILARLFFKLKVEGKDNVPAKGPFIVASNHASFLDVGVVQVAIPHKISWIARKDVYEERFLKFLHWAFNSIPVNGSVAKALAALGRGCVVGIFPEGTRSPDGKFKKADAGVAILALRSGLAVLPVGIRGSFEAFPPGEKFFKPYPITVKIGKPISFQKVTSDVIEEALLEERLERIVNGIKELLK